MSFIRDIERWRTELQLAEKFRKDNFGEYTDKSHTMAGENIDYFENGFSSGYDEDTDTTTTLNFFHVIVKLIVPTLLFQNPKILALPKKKQSEDSAPYAREILNYYYKDKDINTENELCIWDGYVLNRGVAKVGYVTEFGMDIEAEKKKVSVLDKTMMALGLKEKPEEEEVQPEISQKIISERPYVRWVSPFKFLMDPRARRIDDAMWVAEEFEKTVASLKKNKKYKNTSGLKGTNPNVNSDNSQSSVKVPNTDIEEFSVVTLYEIQYRNEGRYYRLVIAKDQESYKELYHEESIYKMNSFQYDLLEFNKHGHLQFKRSDLDKIKNLQDRFTSTIDQILEQLDRFVPKVAYDVNAVTKNGVTALKGGDVGAIIECNKSPNDAIKEIALTQYKQDLKAILEEMINLITIMTGITKAKLLGVAGTSTATAENISQGGETIRIQDMSREVNRFLNSQSKKLWQVVTQFVDLEDLELITGEKGVNPQTGLPIYSWLDQITPEMSQKLIEGQYDFDIEVGSTQKIDSALITKRIENLIGILARTDIIAMMQQQGKKVDLAEILRLWLSNNPEIVRDSARIIQDVTPQTPGLLDAQAMLAPKQGGMTPGSSNNAAEAQRAAPAPSMQGVMQEAGQL